jgi:nucleoid-associated protein YgaU
MQKDLKIGMAIGLVLMASVALWLSTRPSLSTKARMLHSQKETADEQLNLAPNSPNISSNEIIDGTETEQSDSLMVINKLQQPPQPNLPDTAAYEQAEKTKTQKFHIVREGETLSDISYKYYSSSGKWQKILDANRKTIEDANKLRPGTKLIIP